MGVDTDLIVLARLGQEMRKAQSLYFRGGRTPEQLANSKSLEKAFDIACTQVLAPPDLFGKGTL